MKQLYNIRVTVPYYADVTIEASSEDAAIAAAKAAYENGNKGAFMFVMDDAIYNCEGTTAHSTLEPACRFTHMTYHNSQNMQHSLCDLTSVYGSTVVKLTDALEDSRSAKDILKNFRAAGLKLALYLDRETDKYARFTWTDNCGNVRYLTAFKERI